MSQKKCLYKQPAHLTVWLLFFALQIFCMVAPACATEADDQRLQEVRTEIDRKKSKLSQQKKALAKLNKALKKDELKIAKAAKAVRESRRSLTQVNKQQQQLDGKRAELEGQQKQQQQALAVQLRSAYLAGRHDYIKLLLNQQDPGRLERTLNYYQYLNRARIESIEQLLATEKQLEQVAKELQQVAVQKRDLISRQEKEKQQLAASMQKREATRQGVLALLDSEQARLEQLQQSENQLKQLLLSRQYPQEIQLTGLKNQRGKMRWPINGRIRNKFGTSRQGGVRWKGVFMDGKSGSDIRVIHQGKVLYADWVKSMGLVIIVDHGQGYMSLYAHAQALLKEVGDTVSKGEVIALVGQSGGQSRTGLYFELRHKGEPVNPVRWCRS